jgi:hypothetical protein
VRFLGRVVDATGIRPDPAKVLAVEALQLPNSSENLQHVLGLLGYYRKFILNYSSVAEPLRKKLAGPPHSWHKVDGTVPWTDKEKEAFYKLRDALKGSAILHHPNWEHPFELHTDASHHGLGAVLCKRVDGKHQLIAYASRSVSRQEAPYLKWELEALAMIWATRLFSMYLTGTKFRILTDSRAAKALVEANLRWRLHCQNLTLTSSIERAN